MRSLRTRSVFFFSAEYVTGTWEIKTIMCQNKYAHDFYVYIICMCMILILYRCIQSTMRIQFHSVRIGDLYGTYRVKIVNW